MGTTEENIIYQLLETIRGSELNNDEVIDEREIRSLMRVVRAELIMKYSLRGLTIQDVCFQKIEVSNLIELNEFEFTVELPKIIALPSNFGLKLTDPNFNNIPVVPEENYHLSKSNPINKYLPKAKLEQSILTVFVGKPSPFSIGGGVTLSLMIDCLTKKKELLLSAVLDNPSDGIGYDWTKSLYPFPQEIISELKNILLRKDLGVIVQSKSDQVANSKNDTIRYHEQGKVQ